MNEVLDFMAGNLGFTGLVIITLGFIVAGFVSFGIGMHRDDREVITRSEVVLLGSMFVFFLLSVFLNMSLGRF